MHLANEEARFQRQEIKFNMIKMADYPKCFYTQKYFFALT